MCVSAYVFVWDPRLWPKATAAVVSLPDAVRPAEDLDEERKFALTTRTAVAFHPPYLRGWGQKHNKTRGFGQSTPLVPLLQGVCVVMGCAGPSW